MLRDDLLDCKTLEEKSKIIWQHYEKRKLDSNLEPNWTHAAYDLVLRYNENPSALKNEESSVLKELIYSHEMLDGTEVQSFPHIPRSPVRIMHDGWKIGTPTWIFMGRSLNFNLIRSLGNDWIAVGREVPADLCHLFDPTMPKIAWIAYNINDQMGLNAQTANCIGPALYFNELIEALEKQTKKKFSI